MNLKFALITALFLGFSNNSAFSEETMGSMEAMDAVESLAIEPPVITPPTVQDEAITEENLGDDIAENIYPREIIILLRARYEEDFGISVVNGSAPDYRVENARDTLYDHTTIYDTEVEEMKYSHPNGILKYDRKATPEGDNTYMFILNDDQEEGTVTITLKMTRTWTNNRKASWERDRERVKTFYGTISIPIQLGDYGEPIDYGVQAAHISETLTLK